MAGPRIPLATYRLRLNRQFRFEDASLIVPYLYNLGISDIYAYPILKARGGSPHGYDTVDPSCLNPELGTDGDFDALSQKLGEHGMGLLLDIVPNHMSASPENPWWLDVMENGLYSPHASFLDIAWNPSDRALRKRLLLPILTSPYEKALEKQEFTLVREDNGLFIKYGNYRFPLDVKSYGFVLSQGLNNIKGIPGNNHRDFQQLNQLIRIAGQLPAVTSLSRKAANRQYYERQLVKGDFLSTIDGSIEMKALLLRSINLFNGKRNMEQMDSLLEQQVYWLAFWKTTDNRLNYRRFFDVNDMVGIRVEEPAVFEAIHSLVLRLIQEGKITGLWVDHIYGLYYPWEYLTCLQQHIAHRDRETISSSSFYIIIENILSGDEFLPQEWPVSGTSGYDFIRAVNSLFVYTNGIPGLEESYSQLTGSNMVFNDIVYQKKKQVIEEMIPSEMRSLGIGWPTLTNEAAPESKPEH